MRKGSPTSTTWTRGRSAFTQAYRAGRVDFGMFFARRRRCRLDAGVPVTIVAGVHPGCFELFAHEPIRTITDLKGKTGRHREPGRAPIIFTCRSWRRMSGSTPSTDIDWITTDDGASPMELFVRRRGRCRPRLSLPEPQELRARKVGRVILNMAMDKPWSQYFCCLLARQYGLRPSSIRLRPSVWCAPSSRRPTCAAPSRSGPHDAWSMTASRSGTITRSRR